jgi:hypothetical protein
MEMLDAKSGCDGCVRWQDAWVVIIRRKIRASGDRRYFAVRLNSLFAR